MNWTRKQTTGKDDNANNEKLLPQISALSVHQLRKYVSWKPDPEALVTWCSYCRLDFILIVLSSSFQSYSSSASAAGNIPSIVFWLHPFKWLGLGSARCWNYASSVPSCYLPLPISSPTPWKGDDNHFVRHAFQAQGLYGEATGMILLACW